MTEAVVWDVCTVPGGVPPVDQTNQSTVSVLKRAMALLS